MPARVLLVNPWIYDFAAFNMWSRPLGLLKVAEFLSSFDVDIFFIDCTDHYFPKRYNRGKYRRTLVKKPAIVNDISREYSRYGISTDEFVMGVKESLPLDAVFITSLMSYWYPGVKEAVNIIRKLSPCSKVILGGIYATLFTEHAALTVEPDYIHRGPLGDGDFDFPFTSSMSEIREFRPYYKSALYKSLPYAPLLTSTGCPFHCSYCASGILNRSFSQRNPDEVIKEILDLYKLGVKDFAFYDDALLVNPSSHLIPLLEGVVKRGINVRFHTPNGLHATLIDNDIACLMKKAGFRTLRLSLETVNEERQRGTGGKVSNDSFKEAVSHLKRNGFSKEETGAYLMYGLPDQAFEEVRAGVEFLKSLDISVYLTEYSPIPGTRDFNRLVSKGVIPEDIDPLLTNNTVFSCLYSGYDRHEISVLKKEVKAYNNSRAR